MLIRFLPHPLRGIVQAWVAVPFGELIEMVCCIQAMLEFAFFILTLCWPRAAITGVTAFGRFGTQVRLPFGRLVLRERSLCFVLTAFRVSLGRGLLRRVISPTSVLSSGRWNGDADDKDEGDQPESVVISKHTFAPKCSVTAVVAELNSGR